MLERTLNSFGKLVGEDASEISQLAHRLNGHICPEFPMLLRNYRASVLGYFSAKLILDKIQISLLQI